MMAEHLSALSSAAAGIASLFTHGGQDLVELNAWLEQHPQLVQPTLDFVRQQVALLAQPEGSPQDVRTASSGRNPPATGHVAAAADGGMRGLDDAHRSQLARTVPGATAIPGAAADGLDPTNRAEEEDAPMQDEEGQPLRPPQPPQPLHEPLQGEEAPTEHSQEVAVHPSVRPGRAQSVGQEQHQQGVPAHAAAAAPLEPDSDSELEAGTQDPDDDVTFYYAQRRTEGRLSMDRRVRM